MKAVLIGLLISVLAGLPGPVNTVARAQSAGVSDARFARLARGANLPFWFWYTPENVEWFYSDHDLAVIRRLGFTFVRLPFDMQWLYADDDDWLNDTHLAIFDGVLDRILAADLAVMVDLQSTSLADSDAAQFSGALERDETFIDTFIAFWQALAAHLSVRDPEMMFFEPMNEPVFQDDPARWLPMQERILTAIRAVAPENTLIATAAPWSGIDALVEMTPLSDPNIVYNFHFYEPFLFTHQGADWTWWLVRGLRGLPYPSSPEALAPFIERADNDEVRDQLNWYGWDKWDVTRIDARITLAAAWSAQHGVRVICNEFGVFDRYAPPADRISWMHDVRTTLENYGFGWAIWDYAGEFGVARRSNGETFVDIEAAASLGLNTSW